MRRFVVSKGDLKSTMLVHHPRSAFRFPCDACLSTRHTKKDCQNVPKDESLARHAKLVELESTIADPRLAKYKYQVVFDTRPRDVRGEFFPDLQSKLQAKQVERQRQAATAQALAIQSKDKEAKKAAAALGSTRLQRQQEEEKSLRKLFTLSVTKQVRVWNNSKMATKTADARATAGPKMASQEASPRNADRH